MEVAEKHIADFQYRNPDLGGVMGDTAIDGRQWTG
jgi:hypothetical protein